MKLVYKDSGAVVNVGDVCLIDGEGYTVVFFREPHKPSSSGKVSVADASDFTRELYVSVIGAEWIERDYNGLKLGDLVLCNGYNGIVKTLCDWSNSMIEVRLASGLVCVDSFDVKKV